MKIGLAYALKGEIRSILNTTDAKLLETVAGMDVYEIEPDLLAYLGGVGKVNAAMSTQLFIDLHHPDWIINAGVGRELPGPAHRNHRPGQGLRPARRGHHRHGGSHRAGVHCGPGWSFQPMNWSGSAASSPPKVWSTRWAG